MDVYTGWIAENVTETYGKCSETTAKMLLAFPELTRVRGYYYCPIWGERRHWWLVDSSGKVIDPTKDQFPSKGIGHYEPWVEGTEEPTGKCPNCGGYCYGGSFCCSDDCGQAYVAFCSRSSY